jgi:hypothetical protein
MNSEQFSQSVIDMMALPSPERHQRLANAHTKIYTAYLAALQAIASEQAAAPVNVGEDARTLAQVVGHIAAWDRYGIQVAGQMLAGVQSPKLLLALEGFVERDGQFLTFKDVDDFNAYHAERDATQDWVQLQLDAMDVATVLHALFTQPNLLTFERLDRTQVRRKRLPTGAIIEQSTLGWNLWLILLEHYVVDHAAELAIDVVV